ncbi:hypothetical protein ANANG_G00135990 [Anguilla anguilla]|uniref:Exostosin GT47 domain-containing protein n=1 Tax=Anguilla anguilla TaxID=7936 RepID=A0A9D3MD98_ANGAN|nr:hypothetical protein ANANG_G00135990 [Anguilla anguilla]
MKFGRRKICFCIVLVYLIFSLYAAYNVFFNTKAISRVHRVVKKITVADSAKGLGVQPRSAAVPSRGEGWNPWEEDERAESVSVLQRRQEFRAHQARIAKDQPRRHKVQIWGKAAIGLYLWEHILEGPLNPADRKAQWREGEVQSGAITFSFYTGPAVVQGQIPLDTDSVVLVLNGREEQKIASPPGGWSTPARWSGRAPWPASPCPWVNERDVLQWPLGVATYRDFPVVPPSVEMVTSQRPYLCNFLGTVYRNSSREKLMEILKKHGLEGECVVAAREQWVPTETAESLRRYRAALAQSDLTLCPVGVNPECYRVYEACSYGSVPVVEDVGTAGGDWAELPALLERERRMTPEEKAERRRRLLEWYGTFRMRMRDRFTQALEETFFRTG